MTPRTNAQWRRGSLAQALLCPLRRCAKRGLFYVAVTRTTETLILSSIARIPMQQAMKMGLGVQGGGSSRFIAELGSTKPKALPGTELLA